MLALQDVVAFELGLPHRFLGNRSMLPGWPGPTDGLPLYDVQHCTADNGPVRTSAGYQVAPTADNAILAAADTVVIPGITGFADDPLLHSGTLTEELRRLLDTARQDVRWVSICTGAFVLAAYGLLDGLTATTHWAHADEFGRLFPQVRLDPTVLYLTNPRGARGTGAVYTSAGNVSGIDLLLHVLRADHGSAVANRVARGAVVAPWRDGGQAQFIDQPLPAAGVRSAGRIAATKEWALAHLWADLDLAAMAGHAAMSVRTFTRRFRAETGETAGAWLSRAKIDRARRLLEETDLPIDRVAERSGFGTPAALRQQLSAQVGLSPLSYRRRFRAG